MGIGKETNKLEEVEGGLVHEWNDVRLVFRKPRDDPWDATLATLQALPTKDLAAAVRMSERRLRDVLKGRARPHRRPRDRLIEVAAGFAREEPPADDLSSCTAYFTPP